FALLSEAYSYATFEDRIKATSYFVEEALAFARQHADRLKQIVAAADAEPLVGRTLATRATMATAGMIEILMGEVEEEINPVSGAVMNRRRDVSRPERMLDRLWFAPSAFEEVGANYYVPAAAANAVALLQAHGIRLEQTTVATPGLDQFVITSNTARPSRGGIDFGTHELRTITGYWQPAAATAPAGTWVVPMTQPLARLAFILLAPTSDDGLLTWNVLDEMLASGRYPILRAPIAR
ncbi:MAG TPA: hypothetical protein VMM93_11460, partial [Vicinamibacterales bacterium]|nr:hypothetical protein [Vicinamibacterales bacterium]